MADKGHPARGLLADRLDHLFRTVHPKDRGPFTPAEVAEAINTAAGERVISSTYVWQLRTGRRDNPTQRHLSALAAFFGVSPIYFFDDTEADRDAIPPALTAALKDSEIREMALRAAGLSDRSLQAIKDMIESARAVEGMPSPGQPAQAGPASAHPPNRHNSTSPARQVMGHRAANRLNSHG